MNQPMQRLLISLAAVIVALMHSTVWYCQVAAQAPASVQTRDGLKLEFDTGGNVSGVWVEQQALPLLHEPSGFFVNDVIRAAKNIMQAGDFESAKAEQEQSWSVAGIWKVTRSEGGHLAQAESSTAEGSGNVTSPRVPVAPGRGYLLTARVRTSSHAEEFSPGLYIVQYDAEGNLVKVPTRSGEAVQIGVSVPRASQEFASVSENFVTQPRTAAVQVYANIYRSIGRFDLDDVRLEPLETPSTRVELTPHMKGESVVLLGAAPGLDLEIEAAFTSQADYIAVDGIVRDTAGQDRALRVEFRLPVDARTWTWWDDIAESRAISDSGRFAYCGSEVSLGRGRDVSVFPFASLTGNGVGLSLAQRVEQPRLFRISYDQAAGYCLDYNLGLAAETRKFPSSASFHFLIYRHDPVWEMRAAAKKYYDLFPGHFQVRARRQGLYCYGIPADLPNLEDFGFCFDLAGFSHRARKPLQELGVYLLVHPMGTEAHLRWPKGYDWGTNDGRPGLKEIEDVVLTARPEYKKERAWRGLTGRYDSATFEDNRQRVMNSAVHGPDGRFRLYPYNETIEFIATSCDPEIPSPNMAEGERRYYIGRHELSAAAAGSEIDGVDFDNIVLGAGRTFENFRREHFRYVDHPLIYDLRTRRVCIQTGINFYEFVQQIADEMHAQGKLCTGNLGHDPHTQTFFGHLLDKHGGEITYDAPTRHLRGYRMMAYQKPVSHIVYPGTVAAGQEETVMHRWLAFGHFPAISELAYSSGSDFEQGRPLYKRFMPVMQRLAQAGWEPITHATVSGEGLFVERFGEWTDGDLQFTVHNDADRPAAGTLTIDKTALKITDRPIWREVLGGHTLAGDEGLQFALEPHRTKVFAVGVPD